MIDAIGKSLQDYCKIQGTSDLSFKVITSLLATVSTLSMFVGASRADTELGEAFVIIGAMGLAGTIVAVSQRILYPADTRIDPPSELGLPPSQFQILEDFKRITNPRREDYDQLLFQVTHYGNEIFRHTHYYNKDLNQFINKALGLCSKKYLDSLDIDNHPLLNLQRNNCSRPTPDQVKSALKRSLYFTHT